MTIKKESGYNINITKSFQTSRKAIYKTFSDLTVFKLTGADTIKVAFKRTGEFLLQFDGRGKIYGRFAEIIPSEKITLIWNVKGFGREPEYQTTVTFSFIESGKECSLQLEHKNIKQLDSANAKNEAWTEILNDLEKIITTANKGSYVKQFIENSKIIF